MSESSINHRGGGKREKTSKSADQAKQYFAYLKIKA
jgi:hypothetical protein